MGTAKNPLPVKLFLAAMYNNERDLKKALQKFSEKFGPTERTFGPLPVSAYTDYYQKEMGMNIEKVYLTYSRLITRQELASIKTFTNNLEQSLSNNKRTINLDPGYITRDKLILATTKDYYHRIYLAQGIFAEVTLHYRQGRYRFFSWTYPDYKEPGVQELLAQARAFLIHTQKKASK